MKKVDRKLFCLHVKLYDADISSKVAASEVQAPHQIHDGNQCCVEVAAVHNLSGHEINCTQEP